MTRDKHLAWCKKRARAELDAEISENVAISNAITSLVSDLGKHAETADHGATQIMLLSLVAGLVKTRAEATWWIEGFR